MEAVDLADLFQEVSPWVYVINLLNIYRVLPNSRDCMERLEKVPDMKEFMKHQEENTKI